MLQQNGSQYYPEQTWFCSLLHTSLQIVPSEPPDINSWPEGKTQSFTYHILGHFRRTHFHLFLSLCRLHVFSILMNSCIDVPSKISILQIFNERKYRYRFRGNEILLLNLFRPILFRQIWAKTRHTSLDLIQWVQTTWIWLRFWKLYRAKKNIILKYFQVVLGLFSLHKFEKKHD